MNRDRTGDQQETGDQQQPDDQHQTGEGQEAVQGQEAIELQDVPPASPSDDNQPRATAPARNFPSIAATMAAAANATAIPIGVPDRARPSTPSSDSTIVTNPDPSGAGPSGSGHHKARSAPERASSDERSQRRSELRRQAAAILNSL